MTVLKINPKVGVFEKSIRLLVICAVRRTMEILAKLLPTKMAASNCSGSDNNLMTNPAERFLFSLRSLISFGSSEKRATSDPEIRAEIVSNPIKIIIPVRVSEVK